MRFSAVAPLLLAPLVTAPADASARTLQMIDSLEVVDVAGGAVHPIAPAMRYIAV